MLSRVALVLLAGGVLASCNESTPLQPSAEGDAFVTLMDRVDGQSRGPDELVLRPRVIMKLRTSGPIVTGQPINLEVSSKTILPINSAQLTILTPELEAAKQTTFGEGYRLRVGDELPPFAQWTTGSAGPGAVDTRLFQVTVPAPGIYKILLKAAAVPSEPPEDRPYDVADTTRYTYWLVVRDEGGEVRRAFEPELVPEGFQPQPGPFRPGRRFSGASAPRQASVVETVISRLRSALWPSSQVNQVVVNVGYAPFGETPLEVAEGVGLQGILWDEETQVDSVETTVGPSGQLTLGCTTGQEWLVWAQLDTDESSGGSHGSSWGQCGDTIDVQLTDYYYEAFVALEEAIDRIDAHLSYSRSVMSFFVSEEGCFWREISPGDSVGWACYDKSQDLIKLSHHWVSMMADLVAAHEYGHALHEESLGGLWSDNGTCAGHTRDNPSSHICALKEGFAAYLENIGSDTFLVGDWDTLHFEHQDSAGSIEGNVAAFLTDLIDSTTDGNDNTAYSGNYVATVFKTCQTYQSSLGWRSMDAVDQLIWCLENRTNGTLQTTHFPGRPSWTNQSESATEPGSWDADDIRATWLQNVGVDAPPLSVFINGQASVGENEFCTYVATVTNGTPPYTYSWSGLLSGSSSSVSGTMTTSGNLSLTVTDSDSNQDSDNLWVTVSSGGPECVQ